MSESATGLHRQQSLYWREMTDLKTAAAYIRLYRDRLGRRVTAIAAVKAIASSASIAAWAIWRDYALLWGEIIAASQVIDALKEVFPVTKKFESASEHAVTLNSLFIDAQLEWESIFSGVYTNTQISTRLYKLRKLQHDA